MKKTALVFKTGNLFPKAHYVLLLLACFAVGSLSAQISKEEGARQIQASSKEEIMEYYKTVHSRIPNPQRMEMLKKAGATDEMPAPAPKSSNALQMPEKMWFPGEFEEVQAIYLTFPYITKFRDNGQYADPQFDHIGIDYGGTKIGYVDYYIDTFKTQSRFPVIFAEMINGIQEYAQVWINIWEADDSTALKDFMVRQGMPLTNYRFFSAPGNSFWYRDCGPVAFYYGDNDDIAFLDFEYYPGRAMDDVLPIRLSEATGYPVYTTSIEFEGGNILVDGANTLFTSDAVYGPNADTYGQAYLLNNVVSLNAYRYRSKTALSRSRVNDSLIHLMNLDRLKVLPTLQYDGGTGHIDLYADMWDEEHFVFTQYPSELSALTDYTISSKNIDSISVMHSVHGRDYLKSFIPLPKKDNNTWYTSNNDYEKYTRTYSNHTMVNKAIIQPMFSSSTSGAAVWDAAALDSMKKRYPGYNFIPVDVRGYDNVAYDGFDGSGGAIHCVTKQIPAENPIRILHKSLGGTITDGQVVYPITATITNRSGIASAYCVWREKGESEWNTLSMAAGANDLFSVDIHKNAGALNDTIEYYLLVTSNNGKTIAKPITAPKGFYTNYGYGSGDGRGPGDAIDTYSAESAYGQFYPNPATETARIDIKNDGYQQVNVKVVNLLGKIVYETNFANSDEHVIFEMNTTSFAKGLYTVVFSDKKGSQVARKLIVQ